VQRGAGLSGTSRAGFTPLHLTAYTGDVERARVLLESLTPEEIDRCLLPPTRLRPGPASGR
jgi:hypothetical protein